MTISRSPLWAWIAAALVSACGGGGGPDTPAGPAADPVGVPAPAPGADPTPAPAPAPAPVPTPAPAPGPAVTAVGAVTGPVAASALIGPAGGRLDAPDYGLSVIVPAGAFATEQRVTLQPIENTAPGGRGQAWRIGPEGVTAARPITLQWQPGFAQRNGAQLLRIASQGADGVWRSARAGTEADGIVGTTTTHFSDWSLVAGVQLRPVAAEVRVGQQLELAVQSCRRGPDPVRPGELEHFPCGNETFAALGTSGWSVNGVPLGNAAIGTLTVPVLDAARATYQAPPKQPASNPVAVSAMYADADDPTTRPQMLVAQVTVVDESAGCRWLDSVAALKIELEYDYRWSGSDDQSSAEYAHRARVSGVLQHGLPVRDQAWFKGVADSGLVRATQHYVAPGDGYVIDVAGEGAPVIDAAVPEQIHATVDLTTCRLFLYGYVGTPAQHLGKGSGGVRELEQRVSGMAFMLQDVDIGGQRSFGQERLVPVETGGIGGPAGMTVDSHHVFEGQTGTARLRWSLTPQ